MENNIDPDLLPLPPRTLLRTAGETVMLEAIHPTGEFLADIAALPAVPDSDAEHVWTLTVAGDTIPALRTFVVRHKVPVTDEAATHLRTLATTPPHTPAPAGNPTSPTTAGEGLTGPHDDGTFRLTGTFPPAVTSALAPITGVYWNPTVGAYVIPAAALAQVTTIAGEHNIPVAPSVARQVATVTGPLTFDGTVDGLRGIPLTDLKSVTAKRAEKFAAIGIRNIYDLIFTLPRRYLDRSTIATVRTLTEGDETGLIGTVTRINADSRRRMARISVNDGTGTITATFFNAAWQAKRFAQGDRVIMFGKPERYARTNAWSMVNPILDPLEDTTLPVLPIYPQSGKAGVTTWEIHRATEEALSRIPSITDPLPEHIRAEHHLPDRWDAIRAMHHPTSLESVEEARQRLAFDELFRMQTALLIAKNAEADEHGVGHALTGTLTNQLVDGLPFPLTGAQERALTTIAADMAHPHPMNRLLQGDVGAGKTVVSVWALLSAVEAGHQGALMAPTEILARQLFTELSERTAGLTLPDGTPLRVEYFTNRLRGKKRDATLDALANGDIHIAVGTHALIADDITFASLGLAVIDEQHRFGVEQRAALRDKGPGGVRPDMLIMTATPIPRTSAMTVFGDLDVTVLDELPPGRTPIHTTWIDAEPVLDSDLADPWPTVRAHVTNGRQVFVVCPLVEESEKLQATSAKETYDALTFGALHDLRVGLVHGQQKAEDRDHIMQAFRAGDLDIVVATTVIEVGVNVPNATLMVILDAPRFGISQLHQLRGRVGRGAHASECVLIGRGKTPDSRARMEALVESTDGFYLATVDLELRSFGTVYGTKQSGVSDLLVADILADRHILENARYAATQLLTGDPHLNRYPALRNETLTALTPDKQAWLTKA